MFEPSRWYDDDEWRQTETNWMCLVGNLRLRGRRQSAHFQVEAYVIVVVEIQTGIDWFLCCLFHSFASGNRYPCDMEKSNNTIAWGPAPNQNYTKNISSRMCRKE